MAKLLYKLEITGVIEVLTGLHIGGSDVDLNIGGIDNEVAKHNKKPYIPGSSLAGKLRHLIAKQKGYKYLNFNAAREAGELSLKSWDHEYTALLFSGKFFNLKISKKIIKNEQKTYKIKNRSYDDYYDDSNNLKDDKELASHTRLLVRDCYLINENNADVDDFLEDKAENLINRASGIANPRHLERVVSGTKFRLNVIMDVYENDDVVELCKTLHLGFLLLNNDYLGGSGSRGYGAVKVTIDPVKKIDFSEGSIEESGFTEYSFN